MNPARILIEEDEATPARALLAHLNQEIAVILRTAMDGFWLEDMRGRFLAQGRSVRVSDSTELTPQVKLLRMMCFQKSLREAEARWRFASHYLP